jgi:hypothetical protein
MMAATANAEPMRNIHEPGLIRFAKLLRLFVLTGLWPSMLLLAFGAPLEVWGLPLLIWYWLIWYGLVALIALLPLVGLLAIIVLALRC